MKRFILAFVLAGSLAGCITTIELKQDIAAIEAKVAAFIAKIRAKAPIVLAEAQNGLSSACSLVPIVRSEIASFRASISNPSPKVNGYLSDAEVYSSTAAASCFSYTSAMNSGTQVSLIQTLNFGVAVWNAYQAGRSAYQAAQTAAAGG